MLQYTGYLNTMIGTLTPLLLVTSPLNIGHMIQEMRNYQSEQNRTPIEEMLNNTLMEYEHGSNDPTVEEELLQLPSDGDKQSIRWRHD